MSTDVFIALANNQQVISEYYNIISIIIISIYLISLIYAFLNFIGWIIQDWVYYKKWWLKKWNFIKSNFLKYFKYLLYPTIWFFWCFTVWYQVESWFYFIKFIEPFCPDFSLLTKWAKALNYMNALYVLIIFSIAYIIIWLSFWKKALLKTWIGIYIFWVILCYAVPLLSNFFQVECYDVNWLIIENPVLDPNYWLVNCYNESGTMEWNWIEYWDNWMLSNYWNYKNWEFDGDQFNFYHDWSLFWKYSYVGWILVFSIEFYNDWTVKYKSYIENWLYKTFEFYENWQVKEERGYRWGVLEWRQLSYDEDGSIIYQWYFRDGNFVDVSDQMPLM